MPDGFPSSDAIFAIYLDSATPTDIDRYIKQVMISPGDTIYVSASQIATNRFTGNVHEFDYLYILNPNNEHYQFQPANVSIDVNNYFNFIGHPMVLRGYNILSLNATINNPMDLPISFHWRSWRGIFENPFSLSTYVSFPLDTTLHAYWEAVYAIVEDSIFHIINGKVFLFSLLPNNGEILYIAIDTIGQTEFWESDPRVVNNWHSEGHWVVGTHDSVEYPITFNYHNLPPGNYAIGYVISWCYYYYEVSLSKLII